MIQEAINNNYINYDEIIKLSYIKFYNNDIKYDINIIIPVRGRINFLDKIIKLFKEAEIQELKINYIVVEHSVSSMHIITCFNKKINYIHIPCNETDIFNKCLCHNIGAFLLNKSSYFIFHDIDCMPQKSFFSNILQNIKDKNIKAIQTFQKRRVLGCNKQLTDNILDESISINDLTINSIGVTEILTGLAPGGSVMVNYDLFFDVGGYDPELFTGYAPEDQFFWDKLSVLTNVETCNNPPNEVYHLDHLKQTVNSEIFEKMGEYCKEFMKMNIDEKKEFINQKYSLIRNFKKTSINDFFEKIYCINLNRRFDRWENCLLEFNKANIKVERFSAIDGNPSNIISHLTAGGIGCTLSHLEIFKLAKQEKLKNVLIFEDDVEFIEELNNHFTQYVSQIPKDWNLLYFGGNHNNEPLKKISDNICEVHKTYTTHAYAISSNIYDEVIELFSNVSDISDVLMSKIQEKYGKSYVFQPHLAWQRAGYSDILNVDANYDFLKTGYNN